MGPTEVRSTQRAFFSCGFHSGIHAFSPRDAPREMRHASGASHGKIFPPRTFSFSASLSAAHPGAAFTRAVRPRMRPQMRARGTMQAIGVKTFVLYVPESCIGMTTTS